MIYKINKTVIIFCSVAIRCQYQPTNYHCCCRLIFLVKKKHSVLQTIFTLDISATNFIILTIVRVIIFFCWQPMSSLEGSKEIPSLQITKMSSSMSKGNSFIKLKYLLIFSVLSIVAGKKSKHWSCRPVTQKIHNGS